MRIFVFALRQEGLGERHVRPSLMYVGSRPYRDLCGAGKSTTFRFHDLRHSHASQLLRAGVNAKVISEHLGHSKVAFTLDVYGHLLPGMREEAALKTEAGLRAAVAANQKPN